MAQLKLTGKSVAALPPATRHASSRFGRECACPLQSYYRDTLHTIATEIRAEGAR